MPLAEQNLKLKQLHLSHDLSEEAEARPYRTKSIQNTCMRLLPKSTTTT